jgi:hypothetical protein
MNATVFLSYSHSDMSSEPWLERLKMYMAPLRRRGDVEIWDDSKISTGSEWRSEITQAIQRSKAAILLVGPGFLASEFITNEELPSLLQRLQREGLKIYPHPAGGTNWYSPSYSPKENLFYVAARESGGLWPARRRGRWRLARSRQAGDWR